MMEKESVLELISEVTEFNDLHDLLQDDVLDEALALVVKLIMKPDVKPATAPLLIVQLQALSAKYQILAMYYTNIEKGRSGTMEYKKKNLYYTMTDTLDKLVAALKYTAKNGL
jgi:hypothetical protein